MLILHNCLISTNPSPDASLPTKHCCTASANNMLWRLLIYTNVPSNVLLPSCIINAVTGLPRITCYSYTVMPAGLSPCCMNCSRRNSWQQIVCCMFCKRRIRVAGIRMNILLKESRSGNLRRRWRCFCKKQEL